jgi:hypothetical protein
MPMRSAATCARRSQRNAASPERPARVSEPGRWTPSPHPDNHAARKEKRAHDRSEPIHHHRERHRRADARRRTADGGCVSSARARARPRDPQSRPVSEGQALGRAADPGRSAERVDELGDDQSAMVGAAGLRHNAHRRPRQRQESGPVRALVAGGGDRFLRCHRMGGGAALVRRERRPTRHFLLRDQSMVRRAATAAILKGDHPVGRLCRHLPRCALSRRHLQPVHVELVHRAPVAPHARPRVAASPEGLGSEHAASLAEPQSRQRRLCRRAGRLGQDQCAALFGRQLDRLRPASTRQHGSLCARRLAA